MKRTAISLAVAAALALSAPAPAAPEVGYVYPAGGEQGTTFTVEVGGQSLGSVDGVRVSGRGVRASVMEHVRSLDNNELRDTERFLRDIVKRRWIASVMEEAAKGDGPALPDHPWLRDLDEMSPAELERLRTRLFDEKAQPNAQIAEKVVVEVTVAPDAEPGDRELRVSSPDGLSNPLCFQVGTLPELRETQFTGGPAAQVVEPPAVLNGQIMPGEIDRIRIRAREGQRLVIRLHARRLIPYLADAVPGWFQATMALHDAQGHEVAYADDFRFDPDPVLLFEAPSDGVYELEVRDAIYRGRDDFVYRIAVGELPFVTSVFPLGGQAGTEAIAEVDGWNLPAETLRLDTAPGAGMVREADFGERQATCRGSVCYAVDSLPEAMEVEPNDGTSEAQAIDFPVIINGRIDAPGDADVFSFEGQAGQEIVAEVYARRLSSPLDSALRIRDATGAEVAFNDDHKDPERGLITHHADSMVRTALPADGTYTVTLTDAQRDGGNAHAYRLHLRGAQPDFALRLVPSAVNVAPGRSATVEVHALRREGFAGEIELTLADAPEGFTLSEARIPGDEEKIEATLTAPRGASRQVTPIRVEGSALIDGAEVTRRAVPAEDMMQAFLWRFQVPREELLVAVTGSRPVPAVWQPLVPGVRLTSDDAVRIPPGETAQVRLTAPDSIATPVDALRFRLSNRPRGVTLREATATADGVTLTLKADRNIASPGDAAWAIVEVYTEPTADDADAAHTGQVSLGVLPAIAFEIVRR
ncbi:MAG: hypothetical protein ACOCX2_00090 [Armatimonadota bacterium]